MLALALVGEGRGEVLQTSPQHLARALSKLTDFSFPQRDNLTCVSKKNELYFHNDVRTWATWFQYPFWQGCRTKNKKSERGKKKWTGCKPKTDEQTIEFRNRVLEKNDDKTEDDLVTLHKTIETAAVEVAHHTKTERENEHTREC